MSFTVPPSNKVAGQAGFMTDIDNTYAALASVATGNVLNATYAGGADPTGVSDSTAAIQAALNTGYAYLPKGLYLISSALSVPAGAVLTGPPAAINTTPGASHVMPAIIKLASGSNSHMITVAANNAYIGNVELDGNKSGQTTGTGTGIRYSSAFFLFLERVFIHDQFFRGIDCVSGAAAQVMNCSVTTCGDAGIVTDSGSNDIHVAHCQVGNNAKDGLDLAGFVSHVTDNDIFGNTLNGITISNGRGHLIHGNGIDHNQQHGLQITVANGNFAGGIGIVCNTIHSNGLATTATYNSITVTNSLGNVDSVSVTGNNFWLDGGVTNKVAYHVGNSGTVVHKAHGNQFQASSSATGTIQTASVVKDTNETG